MVDCAKNLPLVVTGLQEFSENRSQSTVPEELLRLVARSICAVRRKLELRVDDCSMVVGLREKPQQKPLKKIA